MAALATRTGKKNREPCFVTQRWIIRSTLFHHISMHETPPPIMPQKWFSLGCKWMQLWRGFLWVFPCRANIVLLLSVLSVWGRSVIGEHIGLCITGWDIRFRWIMKGSQEAVIWAGLGCHALSLPLSSPEVALLFVLTGTYIIAYRLWFILHSFIRTFTWFIPSSFIHIHSYSHIVKFRVELFPGSLPFSPQRTQ